MQKNLGFFWAIVFFALTRPAQAQPISPPPPPPEMAGITCSNDTVNLAVSNPLKTVTSAIERSPGLLPAAWSTADTYVSQSPETRWSQALPPGTTSMFYRLSITVDPPYFSDDFELGDGNWTLSGSDWQLTPSGPRSPTNALAYTNYIDGANASATLAHSLDLSGATAPILSFWHKRRLSWGNDHALVDISTNGGFNWINLADYQLAAWTWHQTALDLSGYKMPQVKIRFRLTSSGTANSGDGWYVDDVRLEEKDTALVFYPFGDNFERELDYWIVSGHDWTLTNSTFRSANHAVCYVDYVDDASASAALAHPLDLSGTTAPVLSFWHKHNLSWGNDHARVEVSTNRGFTWTNVADYRLAGWTWHQELLDLAGYKAPAVTVRFRLTGSGTANSGDGWYMDDVRFEEQDTNMFAYPFTDNFEGGLSNWVVSGHDWTLTNSTYRSATNALAYGLYGPGANSSATLVHPLNLSTSTAPVLSFWHKYNLNDGNDHALVDLSTNGGFSWTNIANYQLAGWTWHQELLDLSGYKAPQVKVRFRLTSPIYAGGGDGWYVDDVRIEEN